MERTFGFITSAGVLEDQMEYALKYKFNHIEIDLTNKDSGLETFDRKRVNGLKRLLFDNGISLSLHLPYTLNLIKKGIFSKKKMLDYIKHSFDLATDLSATHITAHIGSFSKHIIWSNPREEYLKKAIDNIKIIEDMGEESQISFAFENLIPLSLNSAYHFIGDNINDFSAIFNSVKSEFIGLCLDLGHANLNEGGIAYIDNFKEKILCVHYHDNLGNKDDHMEIGEGNINWRKTIGSLEKTGFIGPFISECFSSKPHISRDKLLKLI